MDDIRNTAPRILAATLIGLSVQLSGMEAHAGGGIGQVGAALVYASASGEQGKDLPVSKWSPVTSALVFRLDASYRFHPNFALGAHGGVGTGAKGSGWKCVGMDCYPLLFDVGAYGSYHILPDSDIDPWVGLVGGWEMAAVTTDVHDPNCEHFVDHSSNCRHSRFGASAKCAVEQARRRGAGRPLQGAMVNSPGLAGRRE